MGKEAMRDLLIATRNKDKVEEIRKALEGLPFKILSVADLPKPVPEVVEDGETLLANAQKKARQTAKASGLLCLADDTGLEVDALEGAPGVYSARYAGEGATYARNNMKLLSELGKLGKADRRAIFRTVIVLAEPDEREDWTDGCCEGLIADKPLGDAGFGYDPIFYLPQLHKTFAQLTMEEKNKISHRGKALAKARVMLERW
jgi:XTP/dITP diphosphohydrolase